MIFLTTIPTGAVGSTSSSGAEERSAKSVMTRIINGKLHSTPGKCF